MCACMYAFVICAAFSLHHSLLLTRYILHPHIHFQFVHITHGCVNLGFVLLLYFIVFYLVCAFVKFLAKQHNTRSNKIKQNKKKESQELLTRRRNDNDQKKSQQLAIFDSVQFSSFSINYLHFELIKKKITFFSLLLFNACFGVWLCQIQFF